jgi:hypothetical protein
MSVVIDLVTRLRVEIWFEENPEAADTRFEENILNLVEENTLLLLDRGFYHFNFWQKLIADKINFITRIKKGASIKIEQVFTESYGRRDRKISMGYGTKKTTFISLRLIEVRSRKNLAFLFNQCLRTSDFTTLSSSRFISATMAD